MYEKDGEKYFVVDTHLHYWDASPENWVDGQEEYAKGWIDCFYGYHKLGPPETQWPYEKYQKFSEEDLMKDVFDEGHVDVGIFQPTYLKDWYKEGFNTTERNGLLYEKYPGKFVLNTAWDPRMGEDGIKVLERTVDRYGCQGAKLYTAEWMGPDKKGWTSDWPEALRYLERCQELGVKNIH